MKVHRVLLAMLVFTVMCSAADIGGKWVAQVTNPNGAKSERIFNFQVSGDKLTGTITNLQVSLATFEEKGKPPMTGILKTQNADPQAISDGKVAGSDVSFAIVSQGFMGEMRTEYKGKISGDEIKFTVEQGGGMGGMGGGMGGPQSQQIIAKRMP
jgi:hypothetical protein